MRCRSRRSRIRAPRSRPEPGCRTSKLIEERFGVCERAGADTGYRRHRREPADGLLKLHNIATLRSGPDGTHETASRTEHPSELARSGGTVDDVHQRQRGQDDIERVLASGDSLGCTLADLELGTAALGPSPGAIQHLRADVDGEDEPFVGHQRGRLGGHGSRPGAQVQDALSHPQTGPAQETVNHRLEPGLDLVAVDLRDLVLDPNLPGQTLTVGRYVIGPLHR